MPSRKLEVVLFLAVFAIAFPAFAGEEEKTNSVMIALPRDQREFNEKTSRMNSMSTRIEEAEKLFNDLVRRKSTEKDLAEKERIIKAMVEANKDRNKAVAEYNQLKAELNLRYPNQGEHLNRRYQTQSKKSVEEMEGAAGLDELLTRTKKIIEKKYAPFNPPDDDGKKANEAKVTPADEDKAKPLRLEK